MVSNGKALTTEMQLQRCLQNKRSSCCHFCGGFSVYDTVNDDDSDMKLGNYNSLMIKDLIKLKVKFCNELTISNRLTSMSKDILMHAQRFQIRPFSNYISPKNKC